MKTIRIARLILATSDPRTLERWKQQIRQNFRGLPLQIEVWEGEGDPYVSPRDLVEDVVDRKHLWLHDTGNSRSYLSPEENQMLGALGQYHHAHRLHNLTRTGKYFDKFFQDVSRGSFGEPSAEFSAVLPLEQHRDFHDEVKKHTGNFDEHIATSIPTYRETQIYKGKALAQHHGGRELSMLDIGGSEGSFAKSITAYSGGKVRTTVLDPNDAMYEFFQRKSQVPGSKYDRRAFQRGWTRDDGKVIEALNSQNSEEKFDIVHEAMVFQFISNQRRSQISEVKRLLKPGGLFLTEEKVLTDPETWKRNEELKDREYKNLYYSHADLAAKQRVVKFNQDPKESKAVGMVDNMLPQDQFEEILLDNFSSVWQYWDSGNFKGYACSDDPKNAERFVHSVGSTRSKFSTVDLPRKVTRVGERKSSRDPRRIARKILAERGETREQGELCFSPEKLGKLLEEVQETGKMPEFDLENYKKHS